MKKVFAVTHKESGEIIGLFDEALVTLAQLKSTFDVDYNFHCLVLFRDLSFFQD